MGSFNYTCCITNLPIASGDKVKYLLFTENSYTDSGKCSIHDTWVPRTWPISAEYNDYGSIDDYDSNSPAVWAIMAGFQKDLIEVGTGDNTCHDAPARKNMKFEDFLESIWEQRIEVNRLEKKTGPSEHPDFPKVLDPALPTLKNVEDLLFQNGFTVGNIEGEFLVDERNCSWVRVRPSSYSEKKDLLQRVLPFIQERFAAMITCASDNSFEPEIQVMPKYREKEHTRFATKSDGIKTSGLVVQAMVLTKAWNALLDLIPQATKETCKSQIRKAWECFTIKSNLDKDSFKIVADALGMSFEEWEEYMSSYYGSGGWDDYCCRSVIPFTIGLAEHFKLIAQKHKECPFTEQQIDLFLQDVAEYCLIHSLMFNARQYWKPGYNVGPQFGEYKFHTDWHEALSKVASERLKEKQTKEMQFYGRNTIVIPPAST